MNTINNPKTSKTKNLQKQKSFFNVLNPMMFVPNCKTLKK